MAGRARKRAARSVIVVVYFRCVQSDVIIVGGGPAGLSAAIVLARAARRVRVFHAGPRRNERSGSMHNYLGMEGVSPQAFSEKAWEEVRDAGTLLHSERITDIVPTPEGFLATDTKGSTWFARFVLLATGLVDVLPAVEGVEACYGTSVFHCPYCDGAPWTDRALGAIGPGASATGLAITLRGWSRNVTAFTMGSSVPRIHRPLLKRLGIIVVEQEVVSLEALNGFVAAVRTLGDKHDIDALFFNTGTRQASPIPARLGCAFATSGAIKVDAQQRTSVPGVYAAGDAALYTHLVSVAAAEGAKAAIAMNKALMVSGIVR